MRARLLTRSLAVAGMLLACIAAPAQAQSGAAQRAALKIFQDYVTDGKIDPCRHTSAELQLAHENIPPDIEQYAADYPAAIEAAIEARARGDCAGKKPAAGLIPRVTATPAPSPTPKPTPIPTAIPTAIPTKTVVPDPPAPVDVTPSATAVVKPAPDVALERVATARPSNSAPAPVLLLGLLVAASACLALFFVAMKRLGIGEERLAGFSHAWREGRWRLSGTLEDFRDWLRLGR